MLTNSSINGDTSTTTAVLPALHKVVIVNGNSTILDAVDTLLDAAHYDVVFVESTRHAYSQIKRVQPNLVVLCLQIDEMAGFQVLSMLKLDEDTREIPVLTYTVPREAPSSEETGELSDNERMFTGTKPAGLLN